MVKGVLSGNPQHIICPTLELRVSLIIIPVCQAHGVQVTYLYVIVEARHIGKEKGGFSNQDKFLAMLFLFIVHWINCCCRVRLVEVLVEFSIALIHFDAGRFALISVIHCHRRECFPIPPAAWTGVLDTFNRGGWAKEADESTTLPVKRCRDFGSDFEKTNNTCKVMQDGERIILREKLAGKMAIQTEKQLHQQALLARTATSSNLGVVEKAARNALQRIEHKAVEFKKELVMSGTYNLFSLI